MSGDAASDRPVLVTERLELWRPRAGDLAGLVELMRPEVMRRFLVPGAENAGAQFERLLRNAGSWSLYGYGIFTVRLRGTGDLIGTCGVFRSWRGYGDLVADAAEAGWIVAQAHWGKGLASEAMRAALAWFDAEHGSRRVVCIIAAGNLASDAVARKLGFTAYARDVDPADDVEIVLYERLRG